MNTIRIVRSDDEIWDVLNRCAEAEEQGTTAYRGMTYEQGVQYAIRWLTEEDADPVFED